MFQNDKLPGQNRFACSRFWNQEADGLDFEWELILFLHFALKSLTSVSRSKIIIINNLPELFLFLTSIGDDNENKLAEEQMKEKLLGQVNSLRTSTAVDHNI
ncbi:uncharacterized protein ACOB8E_014258 [Sarcophilus harrisii]